jgi:hypothetical protein
MSEEIEMLKLEIEKLRKELIDFKEEVRKNYKEKDIYLGNSMGGVGLLGDNYK